MVYLKPWLEREALFTMYGNHIFAVSKASSAEVSTYKLRVDGSDPIIKAC